MVIILYFLIFPIPLGKELLVRLVWDVKLSSAIENSKPLSSEGSVIGFTVGSTAGFISDEGNVGFAEKIVYGAAVSDEILINYPRIPDLIQGKDQSGRVTVAITGNGYPIILNDRIFLLNPDRSGISEWTTDGVQLWKKNFESFITTLAASESYLLVGLVEGSGILVNKAGGEVSSFNPSGSRLPAVYGGAVSSDEKYVALISGIEPQRFTLYERRKDHFRPVFHTELTSDFRRRVFIDFSNDGKFVFYETPGGIAAFDIKTRNTIMVSAGRPVRMQSNSTDTVFIFTASDSEDIYEVAGVRGILAPGRVFFQLNYPGAVPLLRLKNDSLYLGTETSIVRIDLAEG